LTLAFEKFIAITPELHRYSVEHSSFRDDVVGEVERAGEAMGDLASMQIAGDQAAFMTILARAIGAHDALEVGTFLGYGAIAIARGLPEDGHLICCELDEGYAERAREHLGQAGLDGKVEIRVGPALETLRAMESDEQFDLAFIDANKTEYIDYFEETLPRMRPNGVILLDNTLRDGTVLDPGDSEPARVTAELNDRLTEDDRVDVALLSFADGITMVRKR
jgi:caffeoyl-CoA O-methyltransferase